MGEVTVTVRTFLMGTDKEAARKPSEEAMEVYAAWEYDQRMGEGYSDEWLADELADCVQACCNLAARHGIDMGAAMLRCEARNRARGRYEEV